MLPVLLYVSCTASAALAQSDAKQRQAAAEAYDLGTAAYLSSEFDKAAEWFETANRMSPAAPALLQAARSHQKAGNAARAATLALRLSLEYPDDDSARQYAQSVLDELAGQFMRVDVVCDGCRLDLDGTLQEFHSFFLEPGVPHNLVASFDTGEESTVVQGEAGESRMIEFDAPPAPRMGSVPGPDEPPPPKRVDEPAKPLPPLATYIGAGVTGALLIASIVSTVDTQSGVDEYEEAAQAFQDCRSDCDALYADAKEKLDDGQSKETRTTVLWVATAGAGVATAVIAGFLTNWSGDETNDERLSLRLTPLRGGAYAGIKGRF